MSKKIDLPTATTTLAELLEMGAKIGFGSGRTMRGNLIDRYIDVGNEFGSLGVWDLDAKHGVEEAVSDLVRDAGEHGLDLHGGELPHEDDDSEDDEAEVGEEEDSNVG
jgi:hypothetical protein